MSALRLPSLEIRVLLVLAVGLLLASAAPAITIGTFDDFQNGSTGGWKAGAASSNPPVVVSDAGPAGARDYALLVTATGSGASSRFVTFNTRTWAGDYLAAGIEEIVLDVSVSGPAGLVLRAAVDGPGGRFASPGVSVAPGTGYQQVRIPVKQSVWTVAGGWNVSQTLSNVTTLRLLSNAAPDWRGEPIVTEAYLDNIRAVPEAGTLVMLGAGLAGLTALGRPRGRGPRRD